MIAMDNCRRRSQGIHQRDPNRSSDKILPDIVVHHREQSGREDNLLVVELKKNAEQDCGDDAKLKLLTAQTGHFHYRHGLYINIKGGKFVCTWYQNGNATRPDS